MTTETKERKNRRCHRNEMRMLPGNVQKQGNKPDHKDRTDSEE